MEVIRKDCVSDDLQPAVIGDSPDHPSEHFLVGLLEKPFPVYGTGDTMIAGFPVARVYLDSVPPHFGRLVQPIPRGYARLYPNYGRCVCPRALGRWVKSVPPLLAQVRR